MSLILVVDGLGHGPPAAEAARQAVAVFRELGLLEPAEIIAASPCGVAQHPRGGPGDRPARPASAARFVLPEWAIFPACIVDSTMVETRISMVSQNGTVGTYDPQDPGIRSTRGPTVLS